MANSKRIADELYREIYTLNTPEDVRGSTVNTIYPKTVLDQIFDDKDPTKKSLRDILDDLHYEIITGGKGNIIFPVTSVNEMQGDVVITKGTIGLGRVDNTPDKDKPLSNPQRSAVENMLRSYDFKINLDDLYNHINDTNNPHGVSFEQINANNEITNLIDKCITEHALSINTQTHPDIRNSLIKLWNYTDRINDSIKEKVNDTLEEAAIHYTDKLAHTELFELKEDKSNKVANINTDISKLDNDQYPTTRAVADYVKYSLTDIMNYLDDIKDWVDSITVVDDESSLPIPSKKYYRKYYIINYSDSSHDQLAVCRKNENGTYSWDITTLATYTKFDNTYFVNTQDGLSIDMKGIISQIYDRKDFLKDTLTSLLENYYTKNDIIKNHYIDKLEIFPGTIDGTIRYQINDDVSTMSPDIWVAGLKRLAFLEWVTEDEIANQSIYNRHIVDNAVDSRCLKDHSIKAVSLSTSPSTIFGNMTNSYGTAQEIPFITFVEQLMPFIVMQIGSGYELGNQFQELLDNVVMNPQRMIPGEVYKYNGGVYGIRFKGTISAIPNYPIHLVLSNSINSSKFKLLDAGGTWQYQSVPSEYTILGGSNITGHTFATINMTSKNLQFESISIGDRVDAEYDIWVKYISLDEKDDFVTNVSGGYNVDTDNSFKNIEGIKIATDEEVLKVIHNSFNRI